MFHTSQKHRRCFGGIVSIALTFLFVFAKLDLLETTKIVNMVEKLAEKYGFSVAAVQTLATALQRGHGKQAQFNHPELGGMGQWMPGDDYDW